MKYLWLDIKQQIINHWKMAEMLTSFHFQTKLYHWVWARVQQYFSYTVAVSFIGRGNHRPAAKVKVKIGLIFVF